MSVAHLDDAVYATLYEGDYDLLYVLSAHELREVIRRVQEGRNDEALAELARVQLSNPTLDDVRQKVGELPVRKVQRLCPRCEAADRRSKHYVAPTTTTPLLSKRSHGTTPEERRELVLKALREEPGLTNGKLRDITGLSDATLAKTLAALSEEGIVTGGSSKAGVASAWRLVAA